MIRIIITIRKMYIKYVMMSFMSFMSLIMLEVEESIPTIEASFVDSILSILDLVFSNSL